ncbi:MAG: hypothetical protein U5N26_10980 [Candidatus Marinimicrobia bacterium]|nr:hypothetical protein [Candidatus Neomarinimicrobiota bacterium]
MPTPGAGTSSGDDAILYPSEAFVWKAEGDIHWDMRVEAGDPHPDSALFVYEFYDTEGCDADYTWIYEFPSIFTLLTSETASKDGPAQADMLKSRSLQKTFLHDIPAVRIKKSAKREAGRRGSKRLRK